MLLCFGAAWPVNLAKAWRARTAAGQSVGFLLIVLLGYLSGIIHKIFYQPDWVLGLYLLNFVMVLAALILYGRNRALDRASGRGLRR